MALPCPSTRTQALAALSADEVAIEVDLGVGDGCGDRY